MHALHGLIIARFEAVTSRTSSPARLGFTGRPDGANDLPHVRTADQPGPAPGRAIPERDERMLTDPEHRQGRVGRRETSDAHSPGPPPPQPACSSKAG